MSVRQRSQWPEATEAGKRQELEEGWNNFSPTASVGNAALGHLDFGYLASSTERINFCGFKPPSL